MKLRIRGDTLRLRLKRGEVDRIAAGTSIVEKTHFPDSILTVRLDASKTTIRRCDEAGILKSNIVFLNYGLASRVS